MAIQVVNTRNVSATSFPPGIRVTSDTGFLFLSGMTARPLDLDPDEPFDFPDDIDVQTRMMMENIQQVLDEAGITWREVVKITRFYTEAGGRGVVAEYLQDWNPCTTTLGVERLPMAGAKIMYDVTAAVPEN
jgi:2-iminobutanoate/2-iminopropanoate deaminase/2-aminomuconate deaminase